MKLADDHWNYVKAVLEAHGEEESVIEKIGFHYRTALEHGYKHGIGTVIPDVTCNVFATDPIKDLVMEENQ